MLNRVSVAEMDVPAGRIVYTQWCNELGGIEADLTVTRLGETSFLVVTGAAVQTRDLAWLREHVPAEARCSRGRHHFGPADAGPDGAALARSSAEALAARTCPTPPSPSRTSRELEIGYARVRASRITYVGELGWELYVPAEFATHVFDRIVEAGREFGLTHAGYHAMNACRTEKGYRHWGHDIGPEDDPLAAGLAFCVAWGKPGVSRPRRAAPRPRGRHAHPPPGPAPPPRRQRSCSTTRSRSGPTGGSWAR